MATPTPDGIAAGQRNVALKAFVDQWLHIAAEDGSFRKIYATWFD
jgi:cyclohexadienyl dehydratase